MSENDLTVPLTTIVPDDSLEIMAPIKPVNEGISTPSTLLFLREQRLAMLEGRAPRGPTEIVGDFKVVDAPKPR